MKKIDHKTTLLEKFKAGAEIGIKGKVSTSFPRKASKIVFKSSGRASRRIANNDRMFERSLRKFF